MLTVCFSILAYGQVKSNQYDANGQKHGLWIENGWESHYKHGKLNGVFVSYGKINNKIFFVGEYTEDEPTGTWYMFSEDGIPLSKMFDIIKNDTIVIGDNKKIMRYKPVYKAHWVDYYPSGGIQGEGILLFDEDPLLEFYNYGMWTYYDEEGEVIEKRFINP